MNGTAFSAHHLKELTCKVQASKEFNTNNNNIAFFSQESWGRLEMKPEKNKFKVQAH